MSPAMRHNPQALHTDTVTTYRADHVRKYTSALCMQRLGVHAMQHQFCSMCDAFLDYSLTLE